MSRKLSAKELMEQLADSNERAQAFVCFIRMLAPAKGYHFVTGPRGFAAFLIHVSEDGYPTIYNETSVTSSERLQRDLCLLRVAEEESELESLETAFRARSKFFSEQWGASCAR